MRILSIFIFTLYCLEVKSNEIKEAENQRDKAEQTLHSLKNDVQLGTKKIRIIKSEINRLSADSKSLTLKIRESELKLNGLRKAQKKTEETIADKHLVLTRLVEAYRMELIAYYTTGRTIRPDATKSNIETNYLPFILKARQLKVAEISRQREQLNTLLKQQTKNSELLENALAKMTDGRNELSRKTQDQRQLIASITQDLSTTTRREAALLKDLGALDRRIQTLKIKTTTASISKLKGKLSWPVDGRVLRRFGQPRDDGFGGWQGMVISAPENSEVRSVQGGKVAYAGYLLGYGLVVVIGHNNGDATIYGHNQRLLVETGQTIAARQVIAAVGDTGSLDVSGVYFGLTRDGKAVNPSTWLN